VSSGPCWRGASPSRRLAPAAADVWRRLRFLEKLHDDIEDVRSALLD
jgi:hypothetical protein